jgi:hypothetical protein
MNRNERAGIAVPETIDVAFSDDDVLYGAPIRFTKGIDYSIPDGERADVTLTTVPRSGRYVRLTLGTEQRSTFVDEIGFPVGPCELPPACDPVDGQCKSLPAPDGTLCSDGKVCTTSDSCQGGVCQGNACDSGNLVVCGPSCLSFPTADGVGCACVRMAPCNDPNHEPCGSDGSCPTGKVCIETAPCCSPAQFCAVRCAD